jgi:hypothetical protein
MDPGSLVYAKVGYDGGEQSGMTTRERAGLNYSQPGFTI